MTFENLFFIRTKVVSSFGYNFFFLSAGHINNQYNTCFWELVKSGKSKREAQNFLKVLRYMHSVLDRILFLRIYLLTLLYCFFGCMLVFYVVLFVFFHILLVSSFRLMPIVCYNAILLLSQYREIM